jgi:hypothetical protein
VSLQVVAVCAAAAEAIRQRAAASASLFIVGLHRSCAGRDLGIQRALRAHANLRNEGRAVKVA